MYVQFHHHMIHVESSSSISVSPQAWNVICHRSFVKVVGCGLLVVLPYVQLRKQLDGNSDRTLFKANGPRVFCNCETHTNSLASWFCTLLHSIRFINVLLYVSIGCNLWLVYCIYVWGLEYFVAVSWLQALLASWVDPYFISENVSGYTTAVPPPY